MRYRPLGRTGLLVSEVGLGTVELGMEYGIPVDGRRCRPSEAEAERLLLRALDIGINFIDTAPSYGESETIIGRALRARRSEYVLASKVPHGSGQRLGHRMLRTKIAASVSQSLRALRTDTIDLMQIHSATGNVIREGGVFGVLREHQRRGDIRFIGVTTYGEEASAVALDAGGYDCLQIAYNILDRQAEERLLPLAGQMGVGVIARSVLLKGALTHRCAHLPPELGKLRSAAERLAAAVGGRRGSEAGLQALPEVAYRYVLGHAGVSTALVGTGDTAELEAVVGYAERAPLSPELLAAIATITVSDRDQLDPSRWRLREAIWSV